MFHDTLEPEMLAPPKETWLTGPLSCSEHHVFEHRGNHILYHVPSGAFFQADGVVRDILDVCEGRSLLELLDQLRERYTEKDIMSAFKELHQAEILSFGPAEPFLPFTPPGRIEVVHLGLDITYDGFGTSFFNRENIESPAAQYMTEEVALQAIDLLMKESGRMRQCFVTFQGEEPLLNAQLVEKTIQYGEAEARKRGKEILFDVASESNLLNEQIFTILKKLNAQIVVKLTEPSEDSLPMFQSSGPYSLSSTEVLQRIQEHEADVHLRGQMDNTGPK
ncbi:MAG: hypothetical protein O2954_19680, partial [bacterium]|nr:hypothetical protein [bacterium]